MRHRSSFEHDTGAHPENASRLRAIEEALSERDWLGLELVEAPRVDRDDLLRVHDEPYIEGVAEISRRGGGMLDLDTVASAGSYEAALHAAGGAVAAADRLMTANGGFAFCGLRPPGHHAERGVGMGFCLFNNVAIAAAHAIAVRAVERVLILDWDVHHGNGTEAIFAESDQVLYASIHQSPLYPGTGNPGDVGRGSGEGFTVNLPVPPGAGSDEFVSLVQHVVVPIALNWRPRLIAISAGYDAHAADPLAQCLVDERGYGAMAATMRDLAAGLDAPVLVCLEGGYAVDALAASVSATLTALADGGPPPEAPPGPAAEARQRVARYWPALD